MRPPYYKLGEHHEIIPVEQPVSREDMVELWSPEARVVAQEHIGPFFVSTVFLVIDHGHDDGERAPVLFETMIFGTAPDGTDWSGDYQERYCTWDEAVAGHAQACTLVRLKLRERSKVDG